MNTMRVCFVFASPGIGGAERSMARLMQVAHGQEMQCSVILAGPPNPELIALIEPLGIPWQRVGKWAITDLTRAFREYQPDVAYLFGQIRTLWWNLAARRAGVPILIGAERGSGTRWINRWGRRLDHFLLDAYITNSTSAAEVLQNCAGVRSEQTYVIHNGVSFSTNPPSPVPENMQLGSPSIVCVANIRPLKGQILLLRVVKRLRQEYPDARAVLVGKDMTDGAFFTEVKALGLDDMFTWTGFVSDVRGFLQHADVFVLPSRYREGMPTSILEAMYAGLPVVGTQVGGVAELITNNKTGYIVMPDDENALFEGLQAILSSPERASEFGRAGRERVVQEFTMEQMVKKHIKVFTKVLKTKKRKTQTG